MNQFIHAGLKKLGFSANTAPVPFVNYCEAVASNACPHLLNSVVHELSFYEEINLVESLTSSTDEINALCLVHALRLTEVFRTIRFSLSVEDQARLNINVIYYFPEWAAQCSKDILSWAHWICKCLYLKKAIMHGKFWIGEEPVSRFGRDIPPPQLDFISIRSAIPLRDKVLIEGSSDWLLKSLMTGSDDKANVFDRITQDPPDLSGCMMSALSLYRSLKKWSVLCNQEPT